MVAYLRARSAGGRLVMRIDDLDHPRDKPGAAAQAVEDLRWLGFEWDETHFQSARRDLYADAIARLAAEGLAYPCVCSRRDVEGAQSAPHDGEQLFYPGTCRGRFSTWDEARAALPQGRIPCWRFLAPPGVVSFDDVFAGRFSQDVSAALGDFPLARDEFGAGYTLASTVDDADMGITEVVRGDDLLAATPAQILVQRALGLPSPAYCHVPLVVGRDGRRLAKRHGDTRIASYRAAGMRPENVVGMLAASCGWASPGEETRLADLVERFDLAAVPRSRFTV